jgi:FkbM family methyltransferase
MSSQEAHVNARARTIAEVRRVLAGFDVSLSRLSRSTPAQRVRFINDAAITVVLDIGAHIGDYGNSLRQFGYKGRIESFEPLARPYAELCSRADSDPLWRCHRLALGDTSGTLTLHVAGNEVSSSALDMLPSHIHGAPESSYVGSEEVAVRTVDELCLTDAADRAYLKADVQGFEQHVLAGAVRTLESVQMLELELSLVRLYEGSPLHIEMMEHLKELHFEPIWFERAFLDAATGRLLQMDGIFARCT